MKLSQAINGYLLFKAARAANTTIQTDRVLLKQFKTWLDHDPDVTAIDTETIRAYLQHQKTRGLAPHTRRRIHATLSGLYTWLTSDDIALVETNPVKAVPPPKLPQRVVKTLTHEQINQLLKAADRARTPRRAKALILFHLDTAARASEIATVQLANTDLKSGRVKVKGKRNKERFVYLGKRAISALWLYISDERPDPARASDDHLFLTFDGYPMNRHSVRRVVYRLAAWAGIKASPHLFRHTSAIEHLRHGMDAFSLQKLLGHETLEITRGYLSALADEDVEVQARRTSPADNWRL
jgi:site-specific recombinase XerD